jgi:hypothetical protein
MVMMSTTSLAPISHIKPFLMTGDPTRIYLASSLPYPLLVKPFRPSKLVALVEKLLGDRFRR